MATLCITSRCPFSRGWQARDVLRKPPRVVFQVCIIFLHLMLKNARLLRCRVRVCGGSEVPTSSNRAGGRVTRVQPLVAL